MNLADRRYLLENAECIASQIPYAVHATHELVSTHAGDYVAVLRLDGVAFQTADISDVNIAHESLNIILRNVNSGHPGSITTVHADSARLTFTQLMLLIKDSRSGGGMTNAEIYLLLHSLVDIVAHFKYDREQRKRVCTGIFFDPFKKRMAIHG
jgi:hypothetical protein